MKERTGGNFPLEPALLIGCLWLQCVPDSVTLPEVRHSFTLGNTETHSRLYNALGCVLLTR